jgi:hypothetical protein
MLGKARDWWWTQMARRAARALACKACGKVHGGACNVAREPVGKVEGRYGTVTWMRLSADCKAGQLIELDIKTGLVKRAR